MKHLAPAAFTVAAVATFALAGCAPATGDLDDPDSPVARYHWNSGNSMDALLEGTLTLEGGCLYIVDPSNEGTRSVAAFPRQYTRWDASTETLHFDGVPYEPGDTVAAGGGMAATLDDIDVPEACDLGEWNEVFLVQDSDLEPYQP